MPDYSKTRIQFRRGTAAELAAANPVLGQGEPAFATDTNSLKIGDGSTAYSSLSAISGGGGGGGGISNLVEDTTPQLGGELDINSQDITGTGNITVVGTGTFTEIVKSGGTSSQFLKADGSVDSSTYLTSYTETNDLSAAVTWANVPDANITESSVTQHQAALSITESQISDLQSYLTSETFTSLVQDTTPQLGGALDTNGSNITGTGSINISGDLTTTGNNVSIGSASYGLEVSSSAATLGSNRLQLLSSETVINQAGAAVDFRVEGDTVGNLLLCDASTDRVGINNVAPEYQLDVGGMGRFVHADGMCGLQVEDTGGSGIHIGDCALDGNAGLAGIKHSNMTGSNDYMIVSNGSNTFISAKDGGKVYLRAGGNNSTCDITIHDVGAGGVSTIFNETGSNRDIRMEGTGGQTNLFRLDASENRIGIATATPAQVLDVTTTETEGLGTNFQPVSTPASSGDYQSLIIENRSDSIITKHLESTDSSSTLVLKNLIRYGADFVSIDDAYNAGLGVTYYPKFKVNTDTGAITFADAFTFPTADGSANQILQTDGAGNVTWEDASSGGISNVVEDTTPQLGGDLDANGNDIDMGTNVITDAKVGYWVPSNTSAVSNSTQVTNLVMITQSNYDALSSYDNNTLYFIIESVSS